MNLHREAIGDGPQPAGPGGIEFIEYATSRPQALGQVLEQMGFRPVARHRSREVLLYRQGGMNVIVNAHAARPAGTDRDAGDRRRGAARARCRRRLPARAIDRGAWAGAGAGGGDGAEHPRHPRRGRQPPLLRRPLAGVLDLRRRLRAHPHGGPAAAGAGRAALVRHRAVHRRRPLDDWTAFYRELFGFTALPDEQRFGILPKGRILRSPCGSFYLQLIEPDARHADLNGEECLQRMGLGTPDVPAAVAALRQRGVDFVDRPACRCEQRGPSPRNWLGGVMFELVHHQG
jgi:4-hydroxyphenylpyruvate dioxygenase